MGPRIRDDDISSVRDNRATSGRLADNPTARPPANRAALAMFVVAEVHPFTDGNGRAARLAMNQFLSEAKLTRIIIPTVYRDDYISALKAMSNGHPVPLGRMLARAARFTRWIDMKSKERAFADLKKSNALERAENAKLTFEDPLGGP
jgi:fido (protein-threonine AMPylation protein)